MAIRIHPHARERMEERGITEEEIMATLKKGERFPAKFDRTGFRRNFSFDTKWHGKRYRTKQVEAYAVREDTDWLVITIIARYF